MVFTATATRATKQKIFDLLGLDKNSTVIMEKSPCKENLKFIVRYIDRDTSFESAFGSVVSELKQDNCERTLIYCQTRKQCGLLFRFFNVILGDDMYSEKARKPTKRRVEMFHAGSPDSVKKHILTELKKEQSHLRIIVCTIAFGMGIDCVGIKRVINFGPPKNIESYVQMCGRAGRKGEDSKCILLYNGMLCSHSNNEIRDYLESTKCRRKEIQKHFTQANFYDKAQSSNPCECCDNCALECSCGLQCRKGEMQFKFTECIEVENVCEQRTRVVTKEQIAELENKLQEYAQMLLKNAQGMVSYPNAMYEFWGFQISQVVNNICILFTICDVKKYVEIWRDCYAVSVLKIIDEIFHDVLAEELNGDDQLEDVEMSDVWEDLLNDSSLNSIDINSTAGQEAIGMALDAMDESGKQDRILNALLGPLISSCDKSM